MFDPLSIQAPYGVTQFIDNLPAYDCNRGVIEMLEIIKVIQESGNYYFQGLSFPYGSSTLVPGGTTLNGSFQVPAGAYVTSIQFYNDYTGECAGSTANPAGFKFSIWDKGSKASIFYGDYSLASPVASNMQQQVGVGSHPLPSDPGMNLDSPFGPNYLMNPFIVTGPSNLGWELVSQGTQGTVTQMQVLICVAVPITKASSGHRTVKRGN